MDGAIHTLEIKDTPFDAPIGVAGNLVIAVRSPRSADSVTVMIGPSVEHFEAVVDDAPPGLEILGVLALTPSDETATGLIRTGDAASKYFTMNGADYRITLQDIRSITKADQTWPTYHFLIQEEEPGSAPRRADARTAALADHHAAVRSNDFETVRRTASIFADSVLAELSRPLNDQRLAAGVLYNGGVACRYLEDPDGERAMCSRIIEELDVPDGVIQEQFAKALYARAYSYRNDAQEYDRMLDDLTRIDRRYASVEHEGAKTLVAQSLVMAAHLFLRLGRWDEMGRAVHAIIDRYGTYNEEALTKQVAEARKLLPMIPASS